MFDALAGALAFFYTLWPSYGGSIFLFTVAIMLVLTPLSIKSTRSMIRMQRVQPELKKLQTKYKDDREALNREMMAFYSANNINPFSSCLPLLLQMPVFIVLFRVLRDMASYRRSIGGYYQGLGSIRQHGMYHSTRHYVRNVVAITRELDRGRGPG